MFIELVDNLRCIHPHEDSWLVLSTSRMEGRDVVAGTLGCPVCRAEYAVQDGAVWFAADSASGDAPTGGGVASEPPAAPRAHDPDAALRLAALLGLAEPGGFVLLAGDWSRLAEALPALVDVQPVVLVTAGTPVPAAVAGVNVLVAPPGAVPLAATSLRGAAVDATAAGLVPVLVPALRARGRIVAPAATPVPPGVTELARDEQSWVGERAGVASPPVQLGIARGRR